MKRQEKRAKPGPVYVTPGAVRVKVYQGKTAGYDLFTVAYSLAGRRVRKGFADLKEAKSFADLTAGRIASGKLGALELTNADRDSYIEAMRILKPFSIPLHVALAEYADARQRLPEGVSLAAAVDDFARRHKSGVTKKTAQEVLQEFLEDRKRAGLSTRYLESLWLHLRSFADRFRTHITNIQAADIDRWLADQNGGLRYKRNMRNSVVSLFRFCQQKGYLPREVKTEAELTTRPKRIMTNPEILSPEDLRKLLAFDDPEKPTESTEMRLYVAIGAFTGIRSAELLRLQWTHIHFDTSSIVLPPEITKKGQRRIVPIHPTLELWIRDVRPRSGTGPLFTRTRAEHIAYKHGRKILGEWPANGLRHSYGSYRLAATQNAAQVAEEMGNSPSELKRSYQQIRTRDGRVVTSSLAEAWFSVSPAQPSNVVSIQAAAC